MPAFFSDKNRFSSFSLGIVFFLLTFGLGILVGNSIKFDKQLVNEDGEVQITKVLNLYAKNRSSEVDFNQFWDLWDLVKEKYVEQPVDESKLFYGAMQGLVSGLDDPYSVYFPPVEAEEFAKDLAGEFEGIGAEIGMQGNQLVVVAPLPSSPAERAGVRAGDKIYQINDEDTFGMTLDEAISKIRGPKGTEVTLTVSHDGLADIQQIKIIRAVINVPTILWEMKSIDSAQDKENNIAYLRISYFNEKTDKEFNRVVGEILMKNPSGMILDLRSNPGGYLDTAVNVASEWIQEGVIVKEKSSQGNGKVYETQGKHRLAGIKTVVLVDKGSASGSEIVAGALQDYGVAQIVGMKTYGKGSVQDFEPLLDGSALKLTIARWYTPKDRMIEKQGIEPDIVVEPMFEEIKDEQGKIIDYKDLGLEKALELFK